MSISWETYVLLPVVAVVFSLLASLSVYDVPFLSIQLSAFGGP